MQFIRKYTQDYYASNYEIKQDFLIGSHIVIEEIERYREQYRLYFYYQNIKYSIVLLPKIRLFLNQCHEFNKTDELHPYIQIFMLRNDECIQCIEYYQLPLELMNTFDVIYSFENDITKSFIEWIEHLNTLSFIKMLKYEYKIKKCTSKQQHFLLNHLSYFSIEDYQIECKLSYETARLHLCYLFKLGILSRHKIGKRYVYKGVL